ncbi:RagB/SusD family nutrient uptake outer membrane protein [Tunicatimonas pelagia]|uniref:RagB/SusD family nutrient uptake outer membrane protein n=1 Tax=Tunicatimonas pelagia TaxID=931531 RepID=UPI002666D116|nr:RagB/SusD family nutrient uptake outer membrane protein [Tunicatimonas pelagia]WKN44196.1 RagB/SusD family nutrient uptake outer membrane protein [Tunicatimonas pelagia]
MKILRYTLLLSLGVFLTQACNEDEILREEPLDFLSPSNAFVEPEHVASAVFQLYNQARSYYADNTSSGNFFTHFIWGTDVAMHGRNPEVDGFGDYRIINSQSGVPQERWEKLYEMVYNANVVINRIEEVSFNEEANKQTLLGEAYFFRAWAYRHLGHLYGGVPLVTEETLEPQRDFTRATRQKVYEQVKADLELARERLPEVAEVDADGRLSKAAADHVLSEILISLEDYQGAIDAASRVIDNPNFALMTERFGSRADEPGDVYWDLFRLNNQNRSAGNTEGIWVMQVEYNTPGGYGDPNGDARFYERTLGPQYNRAQGTDGNALFLGPTTYHGGRGQGYIRPTDLYFHEVWQGEEGDIRNSNFNILRRWVVDNPESEFFGDTIDMNNPNYVDFVAGSSERQDTLQYFYPFVLKISMINNHYDTEFQDEATGELAGSARRTYLDWYAVRLAETYLLRAEAYLKAGDQAAAAADINAVRERANAGAVSAGEADIDLILDERARELFMEEPRRVTLARLGLLYDRTQRYNPYAGATIEPHNNLWPIPFSEIERNTLAELTQNEGYD